jgi:hypothetical protein
VGVSTAEAMVCSVVWERGARAPTQDPLEVVEGRERASIGCVQRDEHRQ